MSAPQLPPVPPLTDVLVLRLRAAAGRRLGLRILLIAGWAAALVVSFASDTRPCSAAEPTICGPDLTFAWSAIPLLSAPFLLWIATPAGLVAGIGFAVADLLFDDLHAARVAWGAYGVLCVAVALWWAADAGRSALGEHGADGPLLFVGDVAGATAAVEGARRGVDDRGAEDARGVAEAAATVGVRAARLLTGAGLLLAGLVVAAAYPVLQHAEDAHLQRAQPAEAVVTGRDTTDSEIDLRVGEATFADLVVLDTDTYPVGATVAVHVDPADPTWVQLDAEQHDHTFWLALGLAAVVVGAALGWAELRARDRIRRLVLQPQPGVRGLGVITGDVLLVWGEDASDGRPRTPLAEVPIGVRAPWTELRDAVEPPDAEGDWSEDDDWDDGDWAPEPVGDRDPAGRRRREQAPPAPLVLLGDLRDGGRVIGVLDGEVLLPDGPVRVLPGPWARRLRPWRDRDSGW